MSDSFPSRDRRVLTGTSSPRPQGALSRLSAMGASVSAMSSRWSQRSARAAAELGELLPGELLPSLPAVSVPRDAARVSFASVSLFNLRLRRDEVANQVGPQANAGNRTSPYLPCRHDAPLR